MVEHVFIISMFCLGLHCISREGMILGFIEETCSDLEGNLQSELCKPLFECYCCMVSYWGVIYFSVFGGIDMDLGLCFILAFNFLLFIDILLGKTKFINQIYLCFLILVVLFSDEPTLVAYSMI